MLHRQLLGRFLIVAGAAAFSFASPWPAVAGADSAQVTVVSPGGIQRALSLDALAGSEDVRDRGYLVRSAAGEETRTVSGFSLAAVLAAAGVDTFGFSYLEVQRPVGGSVLLSRHQALAAAAFPDGPPLAYATAGGTGFLRPASDDADANGGDCFDAPQGVTVVLRKGAPLRVRAAASVRRARPGERVDFEARVERAGAGEQLSYSWYFDDGVRGAGPRASHSFARPGSYDVVLGVTAPGDDTGASAVVTVRVGAAPAGGPERRGGGRNRAAGAPDHGAAGGPSGPAAGSRRSGEEDAGAGVPGAGGAAASGSAAAGVPPPRPAAAPPATAAPASASPQSQRPAVRDASPAARDASPGVRVSGLLLAEAGSAAQPAADEPGPAQPAATARTGTRRGERARFGLPTVAWGLLASAGLLGAGALLEARGLAALLPSRTAPR